MKNIKTTFIVSFLTLLLFSNCNKEEDLNNQSTVISFSTSLREKLRIPYYTLDRTGNYLYVFFRDDNYVAFEMLRINLITKKIENRYYSFVAPTSSKTVPVGFDNIVVTDNNDLISSFYNFDFAANLLIKFAPDLTFKEIDTVVYTPGAATRGRTRLLKNGANRIAGIFGDLDASGNWFFRFMHMDDNLDIISQVVDSSSFYDGQFAINNFIKTSDNGFLYCAINFIKGETLIEKRDQNFNLQWRSSSSDGYNPVTLNELNGKYYVYCGGQTLFTLIYYKNGSLLDTKSYNYGDDYLSKQQEPMRKTDNGEFLITALLTNENRPSEQTGLLIYADANANPISYKTFGGKNMLGSGLVQVATNRFLLFYLDAGFKPEGGSKPRIVLRYLDGKGNFIN